MQDVKPGRELDALVAEKVMGWGISSFSDHPNWTHLRVSSLTQGSNISDSDKPRDYSLCRGDYPHYSTDIAAAWLIVEKLEERNLAYCIEKHHTVDTPTVWFIMANEIPDEFIPVENTESCSAVGDTVAHAICLAALKAVA